MEFFSTVEFYLVAVAIAIIVITAFSKSRNEASKYTYMYQGHITFCDMSQCDESERISLVSLEDGKVKITHHNVILPEDVTVNLRIDVCGDEIICVEKRMERIPGDTAPFYCNVAYTAKCFKHIAYNVRYECEHNGKWCNVSFVNNGDCSVQKELKL
jgi:hypothetical protein